MKINLPFLAHLPQRSAPRPVELPVQPPEREQIQLVVCSPEEPQAGEAPDAAPEHEGN